MIFLICGPTCSGKSSLAIKLARAINGEIVNGDAFQVYKELNIGTAKPTLEERNIVPHHLFDFVSPEKKYSVCEYQKEARNIIEKLKSTNKHIIIVGGTGLYQKATLYDFDFQEELKHIDMTDLEHKTNEELFEYLKNIDEKACETIHPNNRKRVLRAIEIYRQNGIKKSSIIDNQNHELLYNVCFVGLNMPRDELYQKINARVDFMIANGLVEEVRTLKEKYGENIQAFQAIGYKELLKYFKKECSLEESIELIKKNSRNYAKRQMTYFKNQLPITWFNDIELAFDFMLQKVKNN